MAAKRENGPSNSQHIFLYFAPLTFLVYMVLPHGYFLDIATSYILKDRLHATAVEVSTFHLLTAAPVYLSLFFGLTRDLWNPGGLRDRGYFIIFATVSAALFAWMAFSRLSYSGLFTGMLLVMLSFRFVAAAYQGLIALIGQEKLMSGRLSALWNIVNSVPYIIGACASGWVAETFTPRQIFICMAVGSLAIALFGFWKPQSVFDRAYARPAAKGWGLVGDIKKLMRHRAIYPAILLMFLFQFSPAQITPFQFYLTDTLHASDAVYGYFCAISAAGFIPMFFLYAYLCKKVRLGKLLWWGIVIAVPSLAPILFIHSTQSALWAAVPIGMMGGIAAAAIYDLAMRSCPPGMQGTLMMMVDSADQLSNRGADLLGSSIYHANPSHGFLYCVLATTAVYACMLPVILLVPKPLLATADGEAIAD